MFWKRPGRSGARRRSLRRRRENVPPDRQVAGKAASEYERLLVSGCDEDEDAFKAKLGQIARQKPKDETETEGEDVYCCA